MCGQSSCDRNYQWQHSYLRLIDTLTSGANFLPFVWEFMIPAILTQTCCYLSGMFFFWPPNNAVSLFFCWFVCICLVSSEVQYLFIHLFGNFDFLIMNCCFLENGNFWVPFLPIYGISVPIQGTYTLFFIYLFILIAVFTPICTLFYVSSAK